MASSHRYCDHCGAANRLDASFCRACGHSLLSGTPFSLSSQTASVSSLDGHLPPNYVLKQQYRILERLGEGGMGAVYKAEDMSLGGRLVAVKEMHQAGFHSRENYEEAVKAFEGEAIMLAKLMHPNLPRIYAHFSETGRWYLVMDFIEGETLIDHLIKAPGGCLPIHEVIYIGINLCAVLGYLHTHKPPIIFRDLKPDNVMLTSDGHLYLIDFGIARHFKVGKARDTNAFVSHGYAAPEQYGRGQTTPRSDIYSLGAMLHHLLSGQHPAQTVFQFAPLHLGNHSGAADLERLIMQMVELDESKRPANIATVREELQRIASLRFDKREDDIQSASPPPASQPSMPKQSASSQPVSQTSASGSSISLQFEFTQAVSNSPIPFQPLSDPWVPPPAVRISVIALSHAGLVWSIAWSPDGTRIASGSEDKTVQIWDIATGDSLLTYRGHGSDEVRAVAWSPDSKHVSSAGWDKTIQVWEASTGTQILAYRGHTNYVRAVAWSPDGKYIVSAGKDKVVRVWHIGAGSKVYTYAAHTDVIKAVTWAPDSKCLASAGHDKTVRVWEAITGSTFFMYSHMRSVYGVVWSPNGRYIASCSEDKTVQVWDVMTQRLVFTYTGHDSWVYAVAWSPDSKQLASASRDKTVHIWEATTGNIIKTYPCQTDQVLTVTWSPAGTHVAYGDGKKVQVKLVDESFEQVPVPSGIQPANTSSQSKEASILQATGSTPMTSAGREGGLGPPTALIPDLQLSKDFLEDFFIIYHGIDRAWAEWIAWQLEDAGYTVQLPVYGFRSDSNFEEEMRKGAAKAKRTIVVLSPEYLYALNAQSASLDAFMYNAITESKKLLLVCVDEHACRHEFSELLKSINYINVDEEDEAIACARLLGCVRDDGTYKIKTRPVRPSNRRKEEPGFPNQHHMEQKQSIERDPDHSSNSPSQPVSPTKGIEIFISYSHIDEILQAELNKHLITLKRQGLITWYDREIGPGKVWKREIDTHLATASIILLLISPDFMFSEYCYIYEMGRAMERHKTGKARVIPIILRTTHLEDTPIAELQALPRNGLPVMRWPDRDEAFVDIVRGVKKALQELTTKL